MKVTFPSVVALASCMFVFGSAAHAGTVSASLFSPFAPVGSMVTPIAVAVGPVGSTSIITSGYTITFSTALDEGVVKGSDANHAIPVAGVSGGMPEYETGDFGSPLTAAAGSAGDYLSTGLGGTITITFTTPQTSLALLWGSIDTGNSLTFNDPSHMVVTGTQIQTLAAGFVSNGFQGPGGSAYVIVDTTGTFTQVVATSSVISFEMDGLEAGTVPFVNSPEPSSAILLVGAGLVGIGCFGLRWKAKRRI
jgi:hypothetical protein